MVVEVFVVGVVLAVTILAGRWIAGRLGLPDAVAYVVLGVLAGLLPGLPRVQLEPDVILLLFLPPLIYYAGFFSDPRSTHRNALPILGQAVGLVIATAVVVAATLRLLIPDLGWAAALTFGAVVAPPDPVAATSVLRRLGAPSRLVTILEGEGLVNDGVAITAFSLAVGAVGMAITPADGVARVAEAVLGGVGYGLLVGIGVGWVRRRVEDAGSQVVLSLITPYVAFVPAHELHSSGVLATVVAAAWLGARGRGLFPAVARVQSESFWRVLNLLLEASLFVLLGLQVPELVAAVGNYDSVRLLVTSALLVGVIVALRLLWTLFAPGLAARLPGLRATALSLPVPQRLVLGWSGPRGAVSLAVGLSIPVTAAGAPFPQRDLLLFLTIVVVLVTLVGQGVTLPFVLRRLGVGKPVDEQNESVRARLEASRAGLRRLDELAHEPSADEAGIAALRHLLEVRATRLERRLGEDSEAPTADGSLRLEVLDAQRQALEELRDTGKISARTHVAVSQELDLDEARLRSAR